MGLFQRAIETYDAMEHIVGVEIAGKETLAPVGHIMAKATIMITIDLEGNFISAEAIEKYIPIPVTEKSSGRTSTNFVAHCLCDKIAYVCPGCEKKHESYVKKLTEWAESDFSTSKVKAIHSYISKNTIINDLTGAGLLKNDNGEIKNADDLICWNVISSFESESGYVWTDSVLQKAHIRYCQYCQEKQKVFSSFSGEMTYCSDMHMKNIVSFAANAKLISANDEKNFTYLGRFKDKTEAFSIGYIESQKAHNAIKWLISNQKVPIGSRVFVCWNPHGKDVPKPNLPFMKNEEKLPNPTEYKKQMYDALLAYKRELPSGENVVFCAFDAATPGRLSVVYYNEYRASDYLERLAYWDETCCWIDAAFGVYSPLLYNIVNFAFGVQRGSEENAKIETDDKVLAQHMQRLLFIRLEKQRFPSDIAMAIAQKANNLQILTKANRAKLLFTACAVIKKYRSDRYREEWQMSLEPDRRDRSYQYGRLLAVLDNIEGGILRERNEDRETNALKMQSVFVRRPAYAAKIIIDRLKTAYYPRLSPGLRAYYERLIGEIMEKIAEFPEEEFNAPLTETYLLGFYLQRGSHKKENNDNMEVCENE